MRPPKQQSFAGMSRYAVNGFGGSNCRSNSKRERPLSLNCWLHLILKSARAAGRWSFSSPKNKIWVEKLIWGRAHRWGVTIGNFANVTNHLHLKIKIPNRVIYRKFIVAVTGMLARQMTGACRGNATGSFWTGLPFARVLKSAFENLTLQGSIKAKRTQQEFGYDAREEELAIHRQRLRTLKKQSCEKQTTF